LVAVLGQLPPTKAADEGPEFYVAAYGGLTIPQSLKEVQSSGVTPEFTFSNLDLKDSAVFGGKLGFFLPGRDRWSGVEAEFFYTNPHIKQQNVTTTIPSVGFSSTDPFPGAHVRVAALAVNWIIRYPGAWFQPYIGVGPGLFWGRISGNDPNAAGNNFGTGSDTAIGLNALGGARIFLSQRVALFGEYKYNRVNFDFGGDLQVEALYQAQHIVGGLLLHF
jgi:opacity protein-like surface antigen